MHYVQKNTLYLAPLPRISANSSKNYRRYNCQTLANISGNLRQISGNIKYPKKNSQLVYFSYLIAKSSGLV